MEWDYIRRMAETHNPGGRLDTDAVRNLVGTVHTDNSFASTSIGTRAAAHRDAYLMIRVPQGHPGLNVRSLSEAPSEREILLPRDTRFVVHAAYQRPAQRTENGPIENVWFIEAEIVPHGWEPSEDWEPSPLGDAHTGYLPEDEQSVTAPQPTASADRPETGPDGWEDRASEIDWDATESPRPDTDTPDNGSRPLLPSDLPEHIRHAVVQTLSPHRLPFLNERSILPLFTAYHNHHITGLPLPEVVAPYTSTTLTPDQMAQITQTQWATWHDSGALHTALTHLTPHGNPGTDTETDNGSHGDRDTEDEASNPYDSDVEMDDSPRDDEGESPHDSDERYGDIRDQLAPAPEQTAPSAPHGAESQPSTRENSPSTQRPSLDTVRRLNEVVLTHLRDARTSWERVQQLQSELATTSEPDRVKHELAAELSRALRAEAAFRAADATLTAMLRDFVNTNPLVFSARSVFRTLRGAFSPRSVPVSPPPATTGNSAAAPPADTASAGETAPAAQEDTPPLLTDHPATTNETPVSENTTPPTQTPRPAVPTPPAPPTEETTPPPVPNTTRTTTETARTNENRPPATPPTEETAASRGDQTSEQQPVPPADLQSIPEDEELRIVPAPPASPPEATASSTEDPTHQLDYLITTMWIESYGVRVNSDEVLRVVGERIPNRTDDQVLERFRDLLARDPRPFFRPGGVTVTDSGGRTHTLNLASRDNAWRPGSIPGRSDTRRAQYKGLHDLQEQNAQSTATMSGNPKRIGAGFSGHFLASGAFTPLPGFRFSAGYKSSTWQQSSETGQTVSRTTEMVGDGQDYRADLNVTLAIDDAPGVPETIPDGVEITLMGGLKSSRGSLPQRIDFTDPFTANPPDQGTPRYYGRYLGNSHPISVESVTRAAAPGTGTNANRTGQGDENLGQWIARRLGYDEISNTRPGDNSGRLKKMVWRWRRGDAHERGEEIREGFSHQRLADYLPTMTNDPVTLQLPNAKGRPTTVTFWSYPERMDLVPDVPNKFNIKHTDKFSKSANLSAGHTSSLTVRPGFGLLERIAHDTARLEIPYYEYSYTWERTRSRSRGFSAWGAHLFHGTDTAVYNVNRKIAVWVAGDTEPTFFDAQTFEALSAQEADALHGPASNRPVPPSPTVSRDPAAPTPEAPAPAFTLHDPFLNQNRITHFGDSLVRNVTYPDRGEVRQVDGKPATVFREYAHRLLTEINRQYPGLVMPHLALPYAEPPRSELKAGWNHRRDYDAAVRNTIRVLEAASLNNFRFQRDDWVSHGVEVKLEETKKYPGATEVRNRPWMPLPPDHISVWLTATVDRPVPGEKLKNSYTGSTAGASAGRRFRVTRGSGHRNEIRASATWRRIRSLDAREYPKTTAGGGIRFGKEIRKVKNRDISHSVTGEHNIKDKGTTQQLFANVVFGARIGTDNDLVPWPSRVTRSGSDRSTDLFPGDSGIRGRIELHALENRKPIPMDPRNESDPFTTPTERRNQQQNAPQQQPANGQRSRVRQLTGRSAEDLFRNGPRSRIVTPDGQHVTRPADTEHAVSDDHLEIIQTPGARRLTQTFHTVQAFNPTISLDGGQLLTALSHTYDELDQDHHSFINSLRGQQAISQILSAYMSPENLAASPDLLGSRGDRLRFESDDPVLSPFRTRTTLSTFYVPTRLVALVARPKAVVESSHTKEVSLGNSRIRISNLSFGVYGRPGFNLNPVVSDPPPPGTTPNDALQPILRPRGEIRWDFDGHGTTQSQSRSFRDKTEVKIQGPSFEFWTDGVLGQSVERKHDFSFLLTVPRAPSGSNYSAWLAHISNAQKGMIPALWVYLDGLVTHDRIEWNPDGTFRVDSQNPPTAPTPNRFRVFDGLGDKGYHSRGIDPQRALNRLAEELRRNGLELTHSSREDLEKQLSSYMNRNLAGVPPLPVQVRSGTRSRSEPAYVTLSLTSRNTAIRQFGGRTEFIEKVSLVTGSSEGRVDFNGLYVGASLEPRFPPVYAGSDQEGAPPDRRPIGMGFDAGYRGQKTDTNTQSTSESNELSHERVLFTPYAVVDTEVTLELTLHTKDARYSGRGDDELVQNVYPTAYLTVPDTAGTDPSPNPVQHLDSQGYTPRHRPARVEAWVADQRGEGYEPTDRVDIGRTPLRVHNEGRAVFDAAFIAAARANGWRPDPSRGDWATDFSPDQVNSAKRFLNDRAKNSLISPPNFVSGELTLRGITPEALGSRGGADLGTFDGTKLSIRTLVNTRGATLLSVGSESRSRDAEQGGTSRSSNRLEAISHGPEVDERGVVSGRQRDRIHENAGGSTAANTTVGEGRSSGTKDIAVAEGPGTKRIFLVSVPARWLVAAEASNVTLPGLGRTAHLSLVEAEAPVTLWISEDEARGWGLDVDNPKWKTLGDAEEAFGKADLKYMETRQKLAELVAEHETRADAPGYRAEYEAAEQEFREAEEKRTEALRTLEEALEAARRLPQPRTESNPPLPPTPTGSTPLPDTNLPPLPDSDSDSEHHLPPATTPPQPRAEDNPPLPPTPTGSTPLPDTNLPPLPDPQTQEANNTTPTPQTQETGNTTTPTPQHPLPPATTPKQPQPQPQPQPQTDDPASADTDHPPPPFADFDPGNDFELDVLPPKRGSAPVSETLPEPAPGSRPDGSPAPAAPRRNSTSVNPPQQPAPSPPQPAPHSERPSQPAADPAPAEAATTVSQETPRPEAVSPPTQPTVPAPPPVTVSSTTVPPSRRSGSFRPEPNPEAEKPTPSEEQPKPPVERPAPPLPSDPVTTRTSDDTADPFLSRQERLNLEFLQELNGPVP
ncbi:hypothetical protein ABH917_003328 [Thermobifida halotolerans]